MRSHNRLCAIACTLVPAFAMCPVGDAQTAGIALPSWPQQFVITSSVPAAFGFAVTRPGGVDVSVRIAGTPVNVLVSGPQSAANAGVGTIGLHLNVTTQDIQRSPLWRVSIAVANPGAAPPGLSASGTISVAAPAVDSQIVVQYLSSQAATRAAAAEQARQGATQRRMALQQRLQADQQQKESRKAAPLSSRALPPPPPRQPIHFANAPALPAPVIGTLDPNSPDGVILPRQLILLKGSNLSLPTPQLPSGTAGQVLISLSAGATPMVATIYQWAPSEVDAIVPDVAGVLASPNATATVVRSDGVRSNAVQFSFTPNMTVRCTDNPQPAIIGPTGALSAPGSFTIHHGQNFFARSGADMIFATPGLLPGWSTQYAEFTYYQAYDVLGPSYATTSDWHPAHAEAQYGHGTNRSLTSVPWNTDPLASIDYTLALCIMGPRGTPDGLICLANAACATP